MRDVKATGRSRGENENDGIRVGSRLGKKGRLCRKTFVPFPLIKDIVG